MLNDAKTFNVDGKEINALVLLTCDESETRVFRDEELCENSIIYQVGNICTLQYFHWDIIGDFSTGIVKFDSSLFSVVREFLESKNDTMLLSDFVKLYLGGRFIYYWNEETDERIGGDEHFIESDRYILDCEDDKGIQMNIANEIIRTHKENFTVEGGTVDWINILDYNEVLFTRSTDCYNICENGSIHLADDEKCYLDYYCYTYGHSYIGTIEFDISLLDPIRGFLKSKDNNEKLRYYIYKNGGKLIKLEDVNGKKIKQYGPQPKITYEKINLPF